MSQVDDLVLWETVREVMGGAVSDQEITEHLITAASVAANNFTSRKLAARVYNQETDDEIYDGTGSQILYLRQFPVNSITAIYEDVDRSWGASTEIDSGSYTFYPNRGKIIFDGILFSWPRTIKVDYNAGYAPIDTPADLVQAILIIVDYWKKRTDDHGWGVTAVGVESKRIAYQLGIPKQAKELMQQYRKSVVK